VCDVFEHDDQLVLASEVACDFQTVRLNFAMLKPVKRDISPGCGVMTRVRPRPSAGRPILRRRFSASASTNHIDDRMTTDDVSPRLMIAPARIRRSRSCAEMPGNRERLAFRSKSTLVRALATRSCRFGFCQRLGHNFRMKDATVASTDLAWPPSKDRRPLGAPQIPHCRRARFAERSPITSACP